MKVLNIHERILNAEPERVGGLIDSLASPDDALWPKHCWPPMRFDRPLGVGAAGGHGPVRYTVEEYAPGRSIKFRFTGPKGFDGFHKFEILPSGGPAGESATGLRHTIDMTTHGRDALSWLLIIRPLHDALLEDALALAQVSLGLKPQEQQWSPWVRFLRRLLAGGKNRPRP